MINNNELYLINKIFFTSLNMYQIYKEVDTSCYQKDIQKIYNNILDLFYDSMDQMLEILDDCGANK